MIKKSGFWSVSIILVFCLTSCNMWDRPSCSRKNNCLPSFTMEQPCAPPCWQGITPGVTTLDDTLIILSNLTFLNSPSRVGEVQIFEERIVVTPNDDAWVGNLNFIDGKVVEMYFWGELTTTFEEAEKSFAIPKEVLYYQQYTGNIVLTVFNLDKGVAYGTESLYLTKAEHKDFLSPQSPVNTLVYWDTKYWELLVENEAFIVTNFKEGDIAANLQKWKGYGKPNEQYDLTEVR